MFGGSLEDIHVAETLSSEQIIVRKHAQRTGFVGRTLRGPPDIPVLVRNYADFQQTFGGHWQPSPLSYAVEHFFEQGGREAVVVRVVNGAAPVTVSIPCGSQTLQLQACAPGTYEFLRVAVDYDRISAADPHSFNLLVQRLRSPGSERIEEQENFRGLSVDPAAPAYITTALLKSRMVRVRGAVPAMRPDATTKPGTQHPQEYIPSNADGNDGQPLSDYDIIGSKTRGAGLFALEHIDDLAFVYVPPLSRHQDPGASALLVAGEFCRAQRAILILDPPADWTSPMAALNGLRALNFYSDSAVMFFPRIVCTDRLHGRRETFGNGGAVAGLLSRAGDPLAAIVNQQEPEALLRAGAKLAFDISAADRLRLATHGINTLHSVRSSGRNRPALRTLACGASASADWAYLAPRRFALFVIDVIERETRWVVHQPKAEAAAQRVILQVSGFLNELRAAGAFSASAVATAFMVICDERVNPPSAEPDAVNILVQFAANRARAYHSFMITHRANGSTVRPVMLNRLQASLRISIDLEQEFTIPLEHDDEIERALVV